MQNYLSSDTTTLNMHQLSAKKLHCTCILGLSEKCLGGVNFSSTLYIVQPDTDRSKIRDKNIIAGCWKH